MISKTITGNYEPAQLTKELQTAFNNSNLDITFRGNTVEIGVAATSENINLLDATIAAHDYNAGMIAKRKASVQAKVNKLLADTDYVAIRQYEQEEKGGSKKLTNEQFEAVMDYRQALRDLPNSITTDEEPTWPTPPEVI